MVREGETLRLDRISTTTGEEADARLQVQHLNDASGANLVDTRTPVAEAVERQRGISLRHKHRFATWNVRSLMRTGKLKVVCKEMDYYDVDILGLAETRWRGKGHFTASDGKTVIYVGAESENRNEYCHGVGFIISKKITQSLLGYNPIGQRIVSIRVKAHPNNITIVQFYAPTSAASDDETDHFYDALQEAIDAIPKRDVLIIMGDANAKVGKQETATEVCGKYGLGESNENGARFIEFCQANQLAISNTMFKQHPRRLYTWISPDQRTRNQIDFIAIKMRWKRSIKNVTTCPGADCGTDHQLLTATLVTKFHKLPKLDKPLRFDLKADSSAYQVNISNKFEALIDLDEEKLPEELWKDIQETIITTAKNHIPMAKYKATPYVSENTLNLVEARKQAKNEAGIFSERYSEINRKVNRSFRKDKRENIEQQCQLIENLGHTGSTAEMYKAVRRITKKFMPKLNTVKDDGGVRLTESADILERWKHYCESLYMSSDHTVYETPETTEKEPPPLLQEVKCAIKDLKNGKSPGIDGIPAELLKLGGDPFAVLFHKLCVKIWDTEEWPIDFCRSVFVVLPKKGDTEKCENNRTIALISHASKILLKIVANRMKNKLDYEIAEEQAGFRPSRGTRDQIFNVKMIMEKYRAHNKDLFMTFIDYKKAFDSVNHGKLWKEMIEMGFSSHLVNLIKKLYASQQACVRLNVGKTEWFSVSKGVRQGCVISPHLFNIYCEVIMRKVLEADNSGVKIGGRIINNLRYADDIVLITESYEDAQTLLDQVNAVSSEFGLFLHPGKTKAMVLMSSNMEQGDQPPELFVEDKSIEYVSNFCYLGFNLNNNVDDSQEIRRRIAIAKNACVSLTSVWKDRSLSRNLKLRLLRSLVFPIATYGCECWTPKKADRKRICSFELWCYRRLLRISWMDRRTNNWVLERIGGTWRLIDHTDKAKLTYFGHIARKKNIENDMMVGAVWGKRRRGRQRMKWIDGICKMMGQSVTVLTRLAKHREEWRDRVRLATSARGNEERV